MVIGSWSQSLAQPHKRASYVWVTNPYQMADHGHLDFSNPARDVGEFIKREWPRRNVDRIPFD